MRVGFEVRVGKCIRVGHGVLAYGDLVISRKVAVGVFGLASQPTSQARDRIPTRRIAGSRWVENEVIFCDWQALGDIDFLMVRLSHSYYGKFYLQGQVYVGINENLPSIPDYARGFIPLLSCYSQ